MALRKFKPVTPGQRQKLISAFEEITKSRPEKSLVRPMKRTVRRPAKPTPPEEEEEEEEDLLDICFD